MNSKICEILGIEFPLVAFSHCKDVVAQVSKAGGMGVLGAVGMTPEILEQELKYDYSISKNQHFREITLQNFVNHLIRTSKQTNHVIKKTLFQLELNKIDKKLVVRKCQF